MMMDEILQMVDEIYQMVDEIYDDGWDLADGGWAPAGSLERLKANVGVATVLGLIPASSDTMES